MSNTQKFKITGITCESCITKIEDNLTELEEIKKITISEDNKLLLLETTKQISITTLQKQIALLGGKYQVLHFDYTAENNTANASWWSTYKPVILIFIYITLVTLTIQLLSETFDISVWMRHFMSAFFLVFSFFKILNLKEFKNSYTMYDIIAKRIPAWGYIYAFIELSLGFAYLIAYKPLIINTITALVMSVSIIGVLQSILDKKSIKCACLGDVFNLPLSTITIIEDALMIVMSLLMLYLEIN